MSEPHKWAKEIHAWADGAEIESRSLKALGPEFTKWSYDEFPIWAMHLEYRIKTEPRVIWVIEVDGKLERITEIRPQFDYDMEFNHGTRKVRAIKFEEVL